MKDRGIHEITGGFPPKYDQDARPVSCFVDCLEDHEAIDKLLNWIHANDDNPEAL